jgi:GTP pyrophosphokinase
MDIPEQDYAEFLSELIKTSNCTTLDDLYAAIGYGDVSIINSIAKLREKYHKQYTLPDLTPIGTDEVQISIPEKEIKGIEIDGKDNIQIKYAQCCNPLPGDDIVGFVTKGHGVSIHKRTCENYKKSLETGRDNARWVHAFWPPEVKPTVTMFKVMVDIIAHPSDLLIRDISNILQEKYRVPINSIITKKLKNGNINVITEISISGKQQLENITHELLKNQNIISVDRGN